MGLSFFGNFDIRVPVFAFLRGVAKPGIALASGARGPEFKSRHPDKDFKEYNIPPDTQSSETRFVDFIRHILGLEQLKTRTEVITDAFDSFIATQRFYSEPNPVFAKTRSGQSSIHKPSSPGGKGFIYTTSNY